MCCPPTWWKVERNVQISDQSPSKRKRKILRNVFFCSKKFINIFVHILLIISEKKSWLFQHGLFIILSINIKAFVWSIIDSTINELFFVHQWNLSHFKTCLISQYPNGQLISKGNFDVLKDWKNHNFLLKINRL